MLRCLTMKNNTKKEEETGDQNFSCEKGQNLFWKIYWKVYLNDITIHMNQM